MTPVLEWDPEVSLTSAAAVPDPVHVCTPPAGGLLQETQSCGPHCDKSNLLSTLGNATGFRVMDQLVLWLKSALAEDLSPYPHHALGALDERQHAKTPYSRLLRSGTLLHSHDTLVALAKAGP